MSRSSTQEALFAAIEKVISDELPDYAGNATTQAEILANLALAYRYASGGPQPGNTVVDR